VRGRRTPRRSAEKNSAARQARRKSRLVTTLTAVFVTVRRATLTPRSASSSVNWTSDSGCGGLPPDELAQQGSDGSGGARSATGRGQLPRKEALECNHAAGCGHIFMAVARDTVDSCSPSSSAISRSVNGRIARSPYSKKFTLTRDNRLGHALYGQERCSRLRTSQRASCRCCASNAGFAVASLAEVIRILLVHPNSRIDRRVDTDDPALLFFPHEHVWNDGARFERADLLIRTGVRGYESIPWQRAGHLPSSRGFQQPCVVARGHQAQDVSARC